MVHHTQRLSTAVDKVFTPGSLSEALAVLHELGEAAKPIAGGTDLMVELDRGDHRDLQCLVDLSRIPDLDRIETTDTPQGVRLEIGALVTHNRCATSVVIRRHARPLAQACFEVGSPPLRNRATVVGNVVTASPANDTISALMVLDAELVVQSVDSQRTVALSNFYRGVRSTVLAPHELVTAIRFGGFDNSWRSIYLKSGLRRAQAISVVHLAMAWRIDDNDRAADQPAGPTVDEVRLAVGSVAPTVVRLTDVEAALHGARLELFTSGDGAAEAARLAAEAVRPIDDVRSTAHYRIDQVAEMTRRAVTALASEVDPAGLNPEGSPPVTLAAATRGRWPTGQRYATSHDSTSEVAVEVNGQQIAAPPPGEGASGSLLEWLRATGHTGVKEGCAEGECGACTVDLDGMAVLSCLIPATRAHGTSITTIEGLAPGAGTETGLAARAGHFHPLQEAFVTNGAVQCGYCIPGFIMAAAKLAEEPDDVALDEGDIAVGLSGNLCRCTGYYKIIDAVQQVLADRDGAQ